MKQVSARLLLWASELLGHAYNSAMSMHVYLSSGSLMTKVCGTSLVLSAFLFKSMALTLRACNAGPRAQEAPDFKSAQMERQQSGADAGPSGQHDLPPAGSRHPRRDLHSDPQPEPVQRGANPAESLQLFTASMPDAFTYHLGVMPRLTQGSEWIGVCDWLR